MEYQVWTYDEYEGWQKKDCGDLSAAQREIMLALKTGKEPLLTVAVPFDVNVKIKEEMIGEVPKGKAKPDKVAGGEGDRQVRRGDEEDTKSLDPGSGDRGPGARAGD